MPALKLLNRFKKEKIHFAIVVDEHGSTDGLVTLTDIVEAIAGELPEQGEDEKAAIVQRDDGSWPVDGDVATDQITEITGVFTGDDMQTLEGFVLGHFGRIPEIRAHFQFGNGRFEVVDMDGNRIDRVLIQRVPDRTE